MRGVDVDAGSDPVTIPCKGTLARVIVRAADGLLARSSCVLELREPRLGWAGVLVCPLITLLPAAGCLDGRRLAGLHVHRTTPWVGQRQQVGTLKAMTTAQLLIVILLIVVLVVLLAGSGILR